MVLEDAGMSRHLAEVETQVDKAAELWGILGRELRKIQ
jgi:hypothetical protein